MTRQQEMEYINKVLDGDRSAFEPLVLDNQDKVYSLALKITKNPDDALDAAQEVFLKAYTYLASFRGDSRFSVWLYRLTYNQCLDLVRSRKRKPIVSISAANDDEDDMDFADESPTPHQLAERRELRLAISKAVDELPEEQRRVFILREFNDYDYSTIAEELDISIGTVKSRLARARKKIAAELVKNGTFTPDGRHNAGKGVH